MGLLRRRREGGAAELPRCGMCGRRMPVGRDGRCPLGHFVGLPAETGPWLEAALEAQPQPALERAWTVETPPAQPWLSPELAAIGAEDDADSARDPQPPPPAAARGGDSGESALDALDDLLAWDAPASASVLDVDTAERPAEAAAEPAEAAAEPPEDGPGATPPPLDDPFEEREDRLYVRRRIAGAVAGAVVLSGLTTSAVAILPF